MCLCLNKLQQHLIIHTMFGLIKKLCNICLVMELIKLYVVFSLRYYNWSTAAPLMLAMQAFQKPLPKVRNWYTAQILMTQAVGWLCYMNTTPPFCPKLVLHPVFCIPTRLLLLPVLHSLHCILLHVRSINLQPNVLLLQHQTDTQVKLCLPFCSPPSYFITSTFSIGASIQPSIR